MTKPCVDCLEPFERWCAWKHPGSASARCRPCYLAYTRRRQTPSPRGGRNDRNCPGCGAPIAGTRNGGTVYCTKTCGAIARRRSAQELLEAESL
jgi:hypothetical protein